MKTKFDWDGGWSGLPDMSQLALKNYFLYALPPGGFLTSLLSGQTWVEVISHADHWNKPILHKYLDWLHEYAPRGSWGSLQRVESWLAKGPAYEEFQKTLTWETLANERII